MKMYSCVTLIGICCLAIGCDATDVANDSTTASSATRSGYLMDSEPTGAMPVGEARESTQDGQNVTLVGLIGGSSEPFIDGLAAFTIVDPKVPYCAPEEGCPTPWDYCCTQNEVKNNIATIKIVNDAGQPVVQSARDLLGVKELSTVVVKGTAKRDDQGNLTVAAKQVFVQKN